MKIVLQGFVDNDDKRLTLVTNHFTANILVDDVEYNRRGDCIIPLRYSIITRTRYATNLKIRKYLRKFVNDSIKHTITYQGIN